jgi:PhnB protein
MTLIQGEKNMKTKVKPIPEGYHSITLSVTFKDSLKAIKFYKKAFGAKELDVFPSPDGKGTMHATMKIGDSIMMMGDERPDQNCKSAESLGSTPVSFYIYVPNVDEVFQKAVDAGATITMPLDDMFWGDRCGSLKDSFGYTWMVATHTRDLNRDEVREGAESFFAVMASKP